MAKDNAIFWIVGVIILILILQSGILNKILNPEPLSITAEYYKNGQKVSGLFSAFIQYDQVRFNIYASNTGQLKISNIKLVDASPLIFKSSLPVISFGTLEVGERNKVILTSNLINASDLVSLPQPVTFWVNISGKDEYNNIFYEESTFSLSFVEDIGGLSITSFYDPNTYSQPREYMVPVITKQFFPTNPANHQVIAMQIKTTYSTYCDAVQFARMSISDGKNIQYFNSPVRCGTWEGIYYLDYGNYPSFNSNSYTVTVDLMAHNTASTMWNTTVTIKSLGDGSFS